MKAKPTGQPKKAIISFLEFIAGKWKTPEEKRRPCRCAMCVLARQIIIDTEPSRN